MWKIIKNLWDRLNVICILAQIRGKMETICGGELPRIPEEQYKIAIKISCKKNITKFASQMKDLIRKWTSNIITQQGSWSASPDSSQRKDYHFLIKNGLRKNTEVEWKFRA